MSKYKAVGIIDDELFGVELYGDDEIHLRLDRRPLFVVIRPVTRDRLDEYRTDPDSVRDFWVEAATANRTDASLDDFFEECMSEADGESMWEDEGFPCKDESFCDMLADEDGLREKVDTWLEENRGIDVGTWECSGMFPPDTTEFDLVLCEPEFLEQVVSAMQPKD